MPAQAGDSGIRRYSGTIFFVMPVLPQQLLATHMRPRLSMDKPGKMQHCFEVVYQFLGGHKQVATSVIEDVAMARRLKQHRVRAHVVRAGGRYGLGAACIGGGQGAAVIVEAFEA